MKSTILLYHIGGTQLKVMKLVLSFMLILLLSGCSAPNKENENVEKIIVPQNKQSDDSKVDVLPISSEDVLRIANEDTANSFNFTKKFKQNNGIGVTTYQNDLNSIKILVYTKEQLQPSAVLLSTRQNNSSANETAKTILASIGEALGEKVLNGIPLADVEMEDGRHIYGYKLEDTGETYSTYRDLSSEDLLSSDNRLKTIEDMIAKQEFKKLLSYVKGYVDDNSLNESDFSYDIVDILSKNENIINDTVNVYDSIERKSQVFYQQEKSIDEENFIVPYLNDSGFLSADMGFIKSDWLFFNDVLLNLNNRENINVSNAKPVRDVVQGGVIEEKIIGHQFQESDIAKLKEASTLTLRFKGKSSDLDKELLQGDIDSIKNLAKISGIKNKLSNLVYTYKTF